MYLYSSVYSCISTLYHMSCFLSFSLSLSLSLSLSVVFSFVYVLSRFQSDHVCVFVLASHHGLHCVSTSGKLDVKSIHAIM